MIGTPPGVYDNKDNFPALIWAPCCATLLCTFQDCNHCISGKYKSTGVCHEEEQAKKCSSRHELCDARLPTLNF